MMRFNYTMNHKADEAYMAKMCHEGWAARRLVEGFWTFEPCRPDEYVYRMDYLRGKSPAEVEALKQKLAAQGVEFVSRYSFWAIFRSRKEFQLYTPEEELAVCKRIRAPMVGGTVIGWLVFLLSLWLVRSVSGWFGLLSVAAAVYAGLCTALLNSYSQLIRRLSR